MEIVVPAEEIGDSLLDMVDRADRLATQIHPPGRPLVDRLLSRISQKTHPPQAQLPVLRQDIPASFTMDQKLAMIKY